MVMTSRAQLTLVFSCTRAITDEEGGDHQLVDIGGHKVVTSLDKLLGRKRGGLM